MVANCWPNDPLDPMVLMGKKQELVSMEWQWILKKTSIRLDAMAIVFNSNKPLAKPSTGTEPSFKSNYNVGA